MPFQVWYASNDTETGEFNDLGVFYTDENGRIELDGTKMGTLGLRDGWFRVRELEPLKGFAKAGPDTQEAFIPAGQGHINGCITAERTTATLRSCTNSLSTQLCGTNCRWLR